MWDEICEQPDALERVVTLNDAVAEEIKATLQSKEIDQVVIAARGTSDNAARYAQYVWGARNRLPVGLAAPSLFSLYGRPPVLKNALVVGISQSGQSPDIVAVLAEAKRQHQPTLAITNDPGSPLAAEADHVFLLHAGPERAVAATKTYTTELGAVALLSVTLDGDSNVRDTLGTLPSQVRFMLDQSDGIAEMARSHASVDHCAVLGRGFNYSTAFEWALKLEETAYVLAQPFSSADFLHGPVALIEPGFPVLAIDISGPTHPSIHALLADVIERDARLVVVSDAKESLDLSDSAIQIPGDVPEWITPIPAIVAAQLFTFHLAVAKGLDPDRPRGLAKVTKTT